jgi:hypothetical protein
MVNMSPEQTAKMLQDNPDMIFDFIETQVKEMLKDGKARFSRSVYLEVEAKEKVFMYLKDTQSRLAVERVTITNWLESIINENPMLQMMTANIDIDNQLDNMDMQLRALIQSRKIIVFKAKTGLCWMVVAENGKLISKQETLKEAWQILQSKN